MPEENLKECQKCGFANLPGARFCGGCAEPIHEGWPADGFRERRWLTVLFCDIVGWTTLTRELGLETASDALDGYYRACSDIVSRHGGHLAQLLGDGTMVYFGYPTAFEDSAARALRAGLELVQQIPGAILVASRPELRIQIRVGVATGWVAMIRGPFGEVLARGDPVNISARLQAVANPNTVVTHEATYQTTKGWFTFEDLGHQSVRGIPEPVKVRRVEQLSLPSMRRSRYGGRTDLSEGTPFVAREKETAFLLTCWSDAEKGRSRVVLLSGEPGIGKSRQVRILREWLEPRGHVVLDCVCLPDHRGTALYPMIEALERNLGLAPGQRPPERLRRLQERVEGRGLGEAMPLLAALLSIELPGLDQSLDMTPKKRRQATFDALVSWIRAEAAQAPVLFTVEDLHWADASTLEFLEELARQDVLGSFTLLTARPPPHFESPWQDQTRVSQLTLERLDQHQAKEMATGAARHKALPTEVLDYVVRRAEGVPLFLEEITRALLESPEWLREEEDRFVLIASLASVKVTDTLNDWLTTRLDRLGSGKTVAQTAAVLGRTFRQDILQALLPEAGDLASVLRHLTATGLLFRQDQYGHPAFGFKHALIQEAAYGSLLPEARRQYHERIANVLATRFEELARAQPELMARHYAGAGRAGDAARSWHLAGEIAFARSAFREAIDAYLAALHELGQQPESADRDHFEIELRAALGLALIQVKGWSVREVEESYGRARELCQRYGDIPIRVYYGTWAAYVVRGNREVTAELAGIFAKILETSHDPSTRLIAHSLLGARAFWTGDYHGADLHLRQGKVYCDRERPREQAQALLRDYGYEGLLYCHAFMLWSDLYQGREQESLDGLVETLSLARASANPYLLATALGWGGALAHDLGDVESGERYAEELMPLALENGLYFWVAIAQSIGGWAKVQRGEVDQGLKAMRDAVASHRVMGSEVVLPYYLSYVAEACLSLATRGMARSPEYVAVGLQAADEGLEITDTNLATHFVPELERLKGELFWVSGRRSLAEKHLVQACKIAAQQGAVLFERRATMALSRARDL